MALRRLAKEIVTNYSFFHKEIKHVLDFLGYCLTKWYETEYSYKINLQLTVLSFVFCLRNVGTTSYKSIPMYYYHGKIQCSKIYLSSYVWFHWHEHYRRQLRLRPMSTLWIDFVDKKETNQTTICFIYSLIFLSLKNIWLKWNQISWKHDTKLSIVYTSASSLFYERCIIT